MHKFQLFRLFLPVLRVVIVLTVALQIPLLHASAESWETVSTLATTAGHGIYLVNVIDTSTWEPPSPDPVGIDYHPGIDRLIVSDSEVDEMENIFQGKNIYVTRTDGHLDAACSTISITGEPTGIAVNPENGHIFISEDLQQANIFEVGFNLDGDECSLSPVITTIDTTEFITTSHDIEGLAYGDGKLFITKGGDEDGGEVYVLSPGDNMVFDSVLPPGDDQLVGQFDTASLGLDDPEGIDFHSERGTLFIVSRTQKLLVEATTDGALVGSYDLSFTGIKKPAGVGIGPASQNPDKFSIYIADRGADNDYDPDENDGKIYEIGMFELIHLPLIFH